MSIEEKAKAYDGALERMKSWARGEHPECFTEAQKAAEFIFPELAESEDEKVRQFLIHEVTETSDEIMSYRNMNKKDVLKWLEKQGEQKMKSAEESLGIDSGTYNKIVDECIYGEQNLADKVEPKFKVGDWIVFNGFTLYIKEVVKGYYRTISKGDITNSYDWDIDNVARLWTIQDAKDGDVLEYQGEIFIIRELKKKIIASHTIEYYCCYDGERFINNSIYSLMDDDLVNIHPSTQEQYNLLLQKMKEAGYTFDFEKKELKKIIDVKIMKNIELIKITVPQDKAYLVDENVTTFAGIVGEMTNLYAKKNHDYGNSFNEGCDKLGVSYPLGRLLDKMNRLIACMGKEAEMQVNESIEDTLKDLGCYSIMTLSYLRRRKNGK